MPRHPPLVIDSSGRITVRLRVRLLDGRTEKILRCLGTTSRRTARRRREALLRAMGPAEAVMTPRLSASVMQLLEPAKILEALHNLPGWSWHNHALVRTHEFPSSREALSFLSRVYVFADDLEHSAECTWSATKVTTRLSTVAAGNRVTEKDVSLAQRLQRLSP